MNVRNLSIAVAMLLVLCGVAWFLQRPAAPASVDPRVDTVLLAGDIASKAAHLQIADKGSVVKLDRSADGTWTDASYFGFPADFSKLSRLIDDLTAAKVQRLVTSRPDLMERLEFKDTSITLSDADGKELWQATLGKSADGGGRYVRFGDEQKGYLVNLSSFIDATPKNWADSKLLELKPDDIAKVEIGFEDSKVAAVVATRATKEDPWKAAAAPDGQQIKAARITSLFTNFGSLRFTDTTSPDDEKAVAARAHSRLVKLTTFDGKEWSVTLGRKPEEKKPKPPAPEKKDEVSKDAAAKPPEPGKPAEPEMETIPAGPVFISIKSSDANATVNTLMQERAFEVSDWIFTGLPAAPADLFEPAPKPAAPATTPAEAPASGKP